MISPILKVAIVLVPLLVIFGIIWWKTHSVHLYIENALAFLNVGVHEKLMSDHLTEDAYTLKYELIPKYEHLISQLKQGKQTIVSIGGVFVGIIFLVGSAVYGPFMITVVCIQFFMSLLSIYTLSVLKKQIRTHTAYYWNLVENPNHCTTEKIENRNEMENETTEKTK